MITKIILSVLVWFGLPGVLYCYELYDGPGISTRGGLLILYIGFSWSIALLIFGLETIRLRLFQTNTPLRSALRLGIYGVIAIALALFASPDTLMFSEESLKKIILTFCYASVIGYAYQKCSRPHVE